MATDSLTTLQANLDLLPPLVRKAVAAADTADIVEIHLTGTLPSASLRKADGRTVRIHSGRAPMAEAEQFVERALGALPGGAPAMVIVLGPGLGYVLDAIEQRAPETRIIAIEPFPALARAMLERRDWRDAIQGKRLTLLVGPEYTGAGDTGRLLDARAAASATLVAHPVMDREFPAEIARARVAADHIVQGAQLNAEARRMFAGRYLLNTLQNLRAIATEGDVEALRDRFAGVPTVVVAAGPSLDNKLAELRAIADRVLIVAVDTTLRPLLAARIHPHLVVAVDPSELNARHMLDVEDTRGSWLVSEGSIDPRVFPEFAGRVFTFKVSNHEPWPWLRAHGIERGTLRAWGSVLTTAFNLAIYAGCDPIVFVGADLAFTGGLHYCRGTMNEDPAVHDADTAVRVAGFNEGLRVHKRVTSEAVDIHGGLVTSTPQFVQFRDWLVSRAAEAAPRRVVNATGAGILHGEGITQAGSSGLVFPSGDVAIRDRVGAAWRESLERRLEIRDALEATLARSGREALPMTAWLDFVAGSLSADQISASIDDAWRTSPVVTVQPESVCRLPGYPASFSAESRGGPRPLVQWQVSVDGGSSWSDIAGATHAMVTFTMTAEDAGKQLRAVFTNRHGSALSAAALVSIASPGLANDFDGDGRAEIVWRHSKGGQLLVWFVDGVSVRDSRDLESDVDLAWSVVGTGDFDGDGRPDLLWRNSVTGANRIWHLDNLTRRGESTLDVESDPAWTVVGVGDFNSDGKPDILWRNSATGAIRLWYMDGVTRTGVELLEAEPDLAWTIAGVGDFNADGKADIVWRNTATGANRVWYMDGRRRTGVGALESEPDLAWRLAGIGDFNGDGKPDILWRNMATGHNVVWYLDGTRGVGKAPLHTVADTEWQVCSNSA